MYTITVMDLDMLWNSARNKCAIAIEYTQKKPLFSFILLTIPILLFFTPMLMTGHNVGPGDADYLVQLYEAARISIMDYRQFPWWNPWISGGVPLYANPQFGLVSIVTPFALLFGGALGYKLAIVTYMIVGFWGLMMLFRKQFGTPLVTSILLAYIWTFSTFFGQRIGGHFTFFVIQLFPWALYFFLRRHSDRWSWLKLSGILSLMVLSAVHNITIMSFAVLGLLYLMVSIVIAGRKDNYIVGLKVVKKDIVYFCRVLAVLLLATAYKLIFTFQYVQDFPREQLWSEQSIGIVKALYAVFGPIRQYGITPSLPQWSWMEAGAYIGLTTGIAAVIVLIILAKAYIRKQPTKHNFSFQPLVILVMLGIFLVLSLGNFIGKISPYLLLQELPVFSSMRVSSRWLVWFALFIIIFIALYRGIMYRKVINILLMISLIQLAFISFPQFSKPFVLGTNSQRPDYAEFQQKRKYNQNRLSIPYDENFTEATMSNYGQIIAGDSLVDTRWVPPWGVKSIRCSIDEGCPLVLSNNARIVSWSPNKIEVERSRDGIIELNMNPGSCWTVNGDYLFPKEKVSNPSRKFLIDRDESFLIVKCVPRLSMEWLANKIL